MKCPKCNNTAVWRFFFKQTDYCCHKCGVQWKEQPKTYRGQYGEFIGPWCGKEIDQLEETLFNKQPGLDWNFFKGKNIWTAWRDGVPLEHGLIIEHNLTALIEEIKFRLLFPG